MCFKSASSSGSKGAPPQPQPDWWYQWSGHGEKPARSLHETANQRVLARGLLPKPHVTGGDCCQEHFWRRLYVVNQVLGARSEAKQVELECGECPAASPVERGAVRLLSSSFWPGQLEQAVPAELQPRLRASWTSRPDWAGVVGCWGFNSLGILNCETSEAACAKVLHCTGREGAGGFRGRQRWRASSSFFLALHCRCIKANVGPKIPSGTVGMSRTSSFSLSDR